MKPIQKTVIALTVTGAHTGTAVAALADTTKGKPFEDRDDEKRSSWKFWENHDQDERDAEHG